MEDSLEAAEAKKGLKKSSPQPRFEPGTIGLPSECYIHCATGAYMFNRLKFPFIKSFKLCTRVRILVL